MSLTSGVTAGRGHPFATRELQPPIIVALPASSPSDELGGSWRRPAARTDYSINLLTGSYRSETLPDDYPRFRVSRGVLFTPLLEQPGRASCRTSAAVPLGQFAADAQEIDEAVPINTVSTFGGPDDPPVVVADELLDALVKAVATPPDAALGRRSSASWCTPCLPQWDGCTTATRRPTTPATMSWPASGNWPPPHKIISCG